MLRFEWDQKKAALNLRKHRVSFDEAVSVFGDPLSMTIPDLDSSSDENRLVSLGVSTLGRLLVVYILKVETKFG